MLKENMSLSHAHPPVSLSPLSSLSCCSFLPCLSVILPVVPLNRCQEGFGVGGRRTLAIKPSCHITTGAGKGGGDGGEKEEEALNTSLMNTIES